MDLLCQITSVVLSMCLLVACIYLVQQVRKAMEQFQKFEKLFRTLREANTKARFMAVSVKDKVSPFETTLQDLQAQIDVIFQSSNKSPKTEVNNGNNDASSTNPADSVRNR